MLTPEQLDEARVKEAIRQCDSPTSVANMAKTAARLAREGWTPPEPVDPDLLAAREWLKTRLSGALHVAVDEGDFDHCVEIVAYLAGCTRGREGATRLMEALEELLTLCEAADEADDLPDTVTGDAMFKARQALASAKRGG